MTINSNTPLPQATTDRVKRKAKWLVIQHRIAESDQDDLEQTVMYELLVRRARVDEARGHDERFLNTVIKHGIASYFASRRAAIRDYRREEVSLDTWRLDSAGEWIELGDTMAEEDGRRHIGQPSMQPEELQDLRIDLRDTVAALPAPLRLIVDLLMELGAARAVAAALGRHHSTVYDALKQIRHHFEGAGLAIYLA